MKLTFKKAKSNRIFQHVADQIQAAILDGSLKAGDTLPSEMKLKDMFETSRGTVREALRVLEQKGLIDIKTGVGGGAAVKKVNIEKITEDLDLLIQYQVVTYDHLAEFREGVEGIVAALASRRAKKGDIVRLKGLLAEARDLLDGENPDKASLVRVDMKLHIALAEIARNPVYLANLQMVHEKILGAYDRFSLSRKHVLEENYKDLLDIVQAVETGEADRARTLAQKHVRRFNRYMKEEHQKHEGRS
jgi:GntR family transcriptional repressor for pyruvate dehydrogenase complex